VPEPVLPRIAAGDTAAVQECLERFGGLVWSLARRASPSAADAEDAAQEIFIDMWRCAHRYDASLAAETTFVTMIARRRLIDRQRRASRRLAPTVLPDDVSSALPATGERVEISEEAAQVAQAMTTLRPEQQQVLKLSIVEGMSHDEISRKTGFPLGTVKTHARRGLMRVREILKLARSQRAAGGDR
jgi:RNA polymerase sigma factor (sigma-70 family)